MRQGSTLRRLRATDPSVSVYMFISPMVREVLSLSTLEGRGRGRWSQRGGGRLMSADKYNK